MISDSKLEIKNQIEGMTGGCGDDIRDIKFFGEGGGVVTRVKVNGYIPPPIR